jgi:hypothetical protein
MSAGARHEICGCRGKSNKAAVGTNTDGGKGCAIRRASVGGEIDRDRFWPATSDAEASIADEDISRSACGDKICRIGIERNKAAIRTDRRCSASTVGRTPEGVDRNNLRKISMGEIGG